MYKRFETYTQRFIVSAVLLAGIASPVLTRGAISTVAIGLGYIATDVTKGIVVSSLISQMMSYYSVQKQQSIIEEGRKERSLRVIFAKNQENITFDNGVSLYVPEELRDRHIAIDRALLAAITPHIMACDRVQFNDVYHLSYRKQGLDQFCKKLVQRLIYKVGVGESTADLQCLYTSVNACRIYLDNHDKQERDKVIMRALCITQYEHAEGVGALGGNALDMRLGIQVIPTVNYTALRRRLEEERSVEHNPFTTLLLECMVLSVGDAVMAKIVPAKLYTMCGFLQKRSELLLQSGVYSVAGRCGVLKGVHGICRWIGSSWVLRSAVDLTFSSYVFTKWYEYCKTKNIVDSCWYRGGNAVNRLLLGTWSRMCKA